MSLSNIDIRVSPLSNRILLARFGKDKTVALETRDIQSSFLMALVQYGFDGVMPAPGESAEVNFGGGDEQFVCTLKRVPSEKEKAA